MGDHLIISGKGVKQTKDILVIDRPEFKTFWINLGSDNRIFFTEAAGEGLAMLSDNVGIVFLSRNLPDMNGLEVLSLIKERQPSTAVLIISSYGTEETCIEAFRRGARDYIKRPLHAGEILEKIRILAAIDNGPQRRRHLSLSPETIRDENYPDIPSHLVEGLLRVRDFVAQNYSDPLTLAAACKMASISKTYFCRYFKNITGHSLRNYHHVVRARMAEKLLRDERLSITDVAIRLGYDDSNYFSTIYKRITGVSPRRRRADQYQVRTDRTAPAGKEDRKRAGQHQESSCHLTPRQGLSAASGMTENNKGGIR